MWFLSVNGWCVCLKPVQLTNPREAENRMRKIFGLLSCLFSTVCRSKRRDILKRTELIVARCGHTFDARTRQGNSHTNTNTEDTVCEQWKLSVRHPLGRRTAGKGKECGWTTYTRAMWMMKKKKWWNGAPHCYCAIICPIRIAATTCVAECMYVCVFDGDVLCVVLDLRQHGCQLAS